MCYVSLTTIYILSISNNPYYLRKTVSVKCIIEMGPVVGKSKLNKIKWKSMI